MRERLRRHKLEIATFLICGSICTFLLWPVIEPYVAVVTSAFPDFGVNLSGTAIVRDVDSGESLFDGDSLRSAVEAQAARIRAAREQQSEPGAPESAPTTVPNAPGERPAARHRVPSFMGADLHGADLHGLDLRGLDLSSCDFRGTNLSGAMLEGAHFGVSKLSGADLSGVDFRSFGSKSPFLRAETKGVSFQRCNFEGCRLAGGKTDCDFRAANLRNTAIGFVGTTGMDVRGADLRGARFVNIDSVVERPTYTPLTLLSSMVYDNTTQVEGLHLGGVKDPSIPFVSWAIDHGALASFPRREGPDGPWALRDWKAYAVLCQGASPQKALAAQQARIRSAIAEATGLRYPENDTWLEVEIAVQALPVEARDPLRALMRSTQSIDLSGLDLSGADLRGLCLESAEMQNTNLSGADLSDCTLAGARIVDSKLDGARLHRANLSRILITSSSLKGADLLECSAPFSTIGRTDCSGAKIACCDFSETKFLFVAMTGARLNDVAMARTTADDLALGGAVVQSADWTQASLSVTSAAAAVFQEVDFRQSTIELADYSQVAFGDDCAWQEVAVAYDRLGNPPPESLCDAVARGGGIVAEYDTFVRIRQAYRRGRYEDPLRRRRGRPAHAATAGSGDQDHVRAALPAPVR